MSSHSKRMRSSAPKRSARTYPGKDPYSKSNMSKLTEGDHLEENEINEEYEEYEEDDDDEDEDDDDNEEIEDDEAEYVYNNNNEDDNEPSSRYGQSLADIILQKLHEKEHIELANKGSQPAEEGDAASSIPPKVFEVYTAIGDLLSKYRSGKLPKAVKVLPHLKNWEEILAVTAPQTWSPAGTYAVTKVFSSNLNVKLVQRFLNLVLLPKCRIDIEDHQKLNYHYYSALKKALFKPAAFYKGVLLPLLSSETCSQREAIIFTSILAKVSIPAIHSAAVLLKILDFPYSNANSIFIRQFLLKKYAFPQRVIESLLSYFLSFKSSSESFPVIWHQTLLTFVQRYKGQLDASRKKEILALLHIHNHHEIADEIRRELLASSNH
jgi:essential nuclear protein 1